MSDRTHALLAAPAPALTPAEDDAAALAALLRLLDETGYLLAVSHGWLVLRTPDLVVAIGTDVPDLLRDIR